MNPATLQRTEALVKANSRRIFQKETKRVIASLPRDVGRLMAHEVIVSPPPELGAMRLEDLIGAVKGWGWQRVMRLTRRAQVSPTRRVRELTPGERERLGAVLRP